MKKVLPILFVALIITLVSCDKSPFEKPENLIPEKKMVEMLIDIHIAEASFQQRKYQDSLVMKSTSADFYYSVLEKYNTPDSVFEKSFIYYASFPKEFERMYRDVTNKLSEMEQQYSGRKNELLDLGLQE